MSEIDERRRLYDEDKEIPVWLRWAFVTINRVGFPIVAFVMMWYLCNVSITKVTNSLEQNTLVLLEVRDTLSRVEPNYKHGEP